MQLSCQLFKNVYYPGDFVECIVIIKNSGKIKIPIDLIGIQLHGDFCLTELMNKDFAYDLVKRPPRSRSSLPDVENLSFFFFTT
jgi:hypothetical protein